MRQKILAPCMERKHPEIFWCTLVILISFSPWLFWSVFFVLKEKTIVPLPLVLLLLFAFTAEVMNILLCFGFLLVLLLIFHSILIHAVPTSTVFSILALTLASAECSTTWLTFSDLRLPLRQKQPHQQGKVFYNFFLQMLEICTNLNEQKFSFLHCYK